MILKDYLLKDTHIVFYGLVAKSTGALYGILTMTMFSKSINLNLWIVSSIVSTVITLANILIVPRMGIVETGGNLNKNFSLSKYQRSKSRKRLSIALIVHFGILIFILNGANPASDKVLMMIVFTLQGIQLPIMLRLLNRNEITYFHVNRVVYLRVSSIGNILSLVSAIVYLSLEIPIDHSNYTFCLFLAIQICILAIQDYLHARWMNKNFRVLQTSEKKQLNHVAERKLTTVRIFLYVPCIASLISFSENNQSAEIGATFLGLNIMTLITYLGTPNNKLIYSIESPLILLQSIRRILLKSLAIFLGTMFLLVILIQLLQFLEVSPQFLESEGLLNIFLMSFLGIFLLPIVIIENNRKLNTESSNWHLNITSLALGGAFVLMNQLEGSALISSIFVSFLASFVVWYSIALFRSMNWQEK